MANYFNGREPFKNCPVCGHYISDPKGHCSTCEQIYTNTRFSPNLPEPLTSDTLTPTRWAEIELIKKHGAAAGKTQAEINYEVYTYAYRVTHPAATEPSPYLELCNIPTATSSACLTRPRFSYCPICRGYVDEDGICHTCASHYGIERENNHFPAPFTKRIFSAEHWQDIQYIKLAGVKAGKSDQEIEQEISAYAQKTVAELKLKYDAIAAGLPDPTAKPQPTPPQPQPIIPSSRASSSTNPAQPTPFQVTLHRFLNHYKQGQCYICKKYYWTPSAAKKCCAEIKKTTPPTGLYGAPVRRAGLGSSTPCPICGGSGRINGVWCDDCLGTGKIGPLF